MDLLTQLDILFENNSPRIEYLSDSEMSSKVSQFLATIDGGIIQVNKKFKKEFENFWKEHEIGHWEFFNKSILPKIPKPITQEKIDQATDKIREEGYPNNEEERYAFNKQIKYLLHNGWTKEQIYKIFEEEYNRGRPDHFEEYKSFFKKILELE